MIVAVGGSAGSLTPLRELLSALPSDSGLAYVVVSHQGPTGQSLLPEILAKTTEMQVREVDEPLAVRPNHLYVVPRGKLLTVHGAVLTIEPMDASSGVSLPIDHFFRSLALDRGPGSVGIILSGTGRDGTLGLAAIRAAAGLALVQDPETAEFDSMPSSAIASQAVDFVLPIPELPSRLIQYARSLRAEDRDEEASSSALERILSLIRVRSGRDFSAYKRETLLRRTERRMGFHGIDRLDDYVAHLGAHEEEIDALWRDWLIGVSSFFREAEAFDALEHTALPPLLAARVAERRLRIWIPGCSTGEEAYSIAMVVLDACRAFGERFDVQIFATDLSPSAIEAAREGRYAKATLAPMGAERLERYFVEDGIWYRARKELRQCIVFAEQDVLHDPPFTRMDLISCRNLLIYLESKAQKALLAILHYSLNPDGVLLLGASEHIGAATDQFSVVDDRWRIFRRKPSGSSDPAPFWRPWEVGARQDARVQTRVKEARIDLTETVRRHLAERFGPPAVVVDLRGEIQQIHGRVGAYLELPPGRANLNVIDLARGELRAPMASALRDITSGGASTVERDVPMKSDGARKNLRLTIGRIDDPSQPAPLLLISFESAFRRRGWLARKLRSPGRWLDRSRLEEDLTHVRDDLDASTSELRMRNEELASANEEIQAANEELQSGNEELQTTQEETQSLNEELQTVNAELEGKLQALEQANDDLVNLMSNIEVATIFLDDRLQVKRFTPQARSVARLIDGDIGRPLSDLATLIDYPDLLTDAGRVLASLAETEREVRGPGGVWYRVRIRPYRTKRNAVEGLVVTFIDVTDTKRAERDVAARRLAESIVDAVHEPLLVLEPDLRVLNANRAFHETFGLERSEVEGRLLSELGGHSWLGSALGDRLDAVITEGAGFEGFETIQEFPHAGLRRVVLSGRGVVMNDGEQPVLIVLGIEDAGPAIATGEGGGEA